MPVYGVFVGVIREGRIACPKRVPHFLPLKKVSVSADESRSALTLVWARGPGRHRTHELCSCLGTLPRGRAGGRAGLEA